MSKGNEFFMEGFVMRGRSTCPKIKQLTRCIITC
jgi:hypothetical protein